MCFFLLYRSAGGFWCQDVISRLMMRPPKKFCYIICFNKCEIKCHAVTKYEHHRHDSWIYSTLHLTSTEFNPHAQYKQYHLNNFLSAEAHKECSTAAFSLASLHSSLILSPHLPLSFSLQLSWCYLSFANLNIQRFSFTFIHSWLCTFFGKYFSFWNLYWI